MGLKEAFKNGAIAAFNAAGNVKTSVTYRSKFNANPSFDPETSIVKNTYTDYIDVEFIFLKYEVKEIDGTSILRNDIKAIIPFDNLTPTPKRDDIILLSSIPWNVVEFNTDPADALWEFQLRKP